MVLAAMLVVGEGEMEGKFIESAFGPFPVGDKEPTTAFRITYRGSLIVFWGCALVSVGTALAHPIPAGWWTLPLLVGTVVSLLLPYYTFIWTARQARGRWRYFFPLPLVAVPLSLIGCGTWVVRIAESGQDVVAAGLVLGPAQLIFYSAAVLLLQAVVWVIIGPPKRAIPPPHPDSPGTSRSSG